MRKVNAQVKVGCPVAGMAALADSADDMDLLRHGAVPALFAGTRLRGGTLPPPGPRARPGRTGLRRLDRRSPGTSAVGLLPCQRPHGSRSPRSPATCCAPPVPLASLAYAKARGATLRRDLIDVAARTARHGRGHLTLHLPEGWHREQEWSTATAESSP
jgi:hypothetical protein